MKPAKEWLNEVGKTVVTAAFNSKNPGVEIEALIEKIQMDAAGGIATDRLPVRPDGRFYGVKPARQFVETGEIFEDIEELVKTLEYCAKLMKLDGRTGEVAETKETSDKMRAKYLREERRT